MQNPRAALGTSIDRGRMGPGLHIVQSGQQRICGCVGHSDGQRLHYKSQINDAIFVGILLDDN